MLNSVLTLFAVEYGHDAIGMPTKTERPRDVYCDVSSVSASEFFEAGRNGLAPEFRFTMFAHDYNGERICKYNGVRYSIYRTFRDTTDRIELYVQIEGGTNA